LRTNSRSFPSSKVARADLVAVFKAQRDFADISRRLDLPSLFPNALQTPVNWYQFAFLMGNGFGSGRGDNSPEGKLAAAEKLREVLRRTRSSAAAITARRR